MWDRARPLNFFEKIFNFNVRITECALEREAVNFIMEWENNYSPVLMLHLYVTAFSMRLDETQPLQRGQDPPPRKQIHTVSSTNS